jgi:hypothetical protein
VTGAEVDVHFTDDDEHPARTRAKRHRVRR